MNGAWVCCETVVLHLTLQIKQQCRDVTVLCNCSGFIPDITGVNTVGILGGCCWQLCHGHQEISRLWDTLQVGFIHRQPAVMGALAEPPRVFRI